MAELTQDHKAKPAPALCPLCGDTLKHGKRFMTHFYTCPACPFAGVEYIEKADADNLADVLKNGKPCVVCSSLTTNPDEVCDRPSCESENDGGKSYENA